MVAWLNVVAFAAVFFVQGRAVIGKELFVFIICVFIEICSWFRKHSEWCVCKWNLMFSQRFLGPQPKKQLDPNQNIMPVTPRFVYFLNIKASCIEGRELGIEKGMLKRTC